jgi:thioesterase domain-containing protein
MAGDPDGETDGAGRNAEFLRQLAEVERAYEPPTFAGNVVVYATEETARFSGSWTLGWERYVSGAIRVVQAPGSHLSMLTLPHVQIVADDMSQRLRAIERAMSVPGNGRSESVD